MKSCIGILGVIVLLYLSWLCKELCRKHRSLPANLSKLVGSALILLLCVLF